MKNTQTGRKNCQITPFIFYLAQDRQKRWSIRIVSIDDKPWFVATDVINGLHAMKYATMMMRRIPEEEKQFLKMPTATGWHELSVLNEKGLSSILYRTRKQEVENFRKWCLDDLLPQIHKAYATNPSMLDRFRQIIKSLHKQPETVPAREAQDE